MLENSYEELDPLKQVIAVPEKKELPFYDADEHETMTEAERVEMYQAWNEYRENLFRNAVGHGGGDVAVRVGPLDHGFYVEDAGDGIPPDERDSEFILGYRQPGFSLIIWVDVACGKSSFGLG